MELNPTDKHWMLLVNGRLLDRLFGTYHLPADGRWPSGYGIDQEMPRGFLRQFLYPFSSSR